MSKSEYPEDGLAKYASGPMALACAWQLSIAPEPVVSNAVDNVGIAFAAVVGIVSIGAVTRDIYQRCKTNNQPAEEMRHE